MGRLDGKAAVVTGAGGSRGIGRAIALLMAKEGASVVVNDFGTTPDGVKCADLVVNKIIAEGGKAVANYDSVASMEGGENIIKTCVDAFGKIDILVNTAGNFVNQPIPETTEEVWDRTMAIHVKGHFACCKAAYLQMIKQGTGGKIVNYSSRSLIFMRPIGWAYAAAKGAIIGVTAQLAEDAQRNHPEIQVNCVLPSAITDLFPKDKSDMGDGMPLGPHASSEDVAPMTVFLCTEAANKIQGQYFYVAGGDIALYEKPFDMKGTGHKFIRKAGMESWTLDELDEIVPKFYE